MKLMFFSKKNIILIFFLILGWDSSFLAKFFAKNVYISRKNFWLKPKHFDLWAMSKKMPVSWQNSFGSIVIFAFPVSTETLWDKRFYFRKKYQFDSVCWFWRKKFCIFGKSLRLGCSNRNLRDERNILKKVFPEEDTVLYHFMVFPRKLWVARKLQVPHVGIPRVQRNISRKKFWLKPKHFDLWAMSKKMPVSWQNSFGSVVIFAFRVSSETLWDKRFYFRKKYQFDSVCWFWRKKFCIFGKSVRLRCSNRNLRDERNILKKVFPEEDTVLYHFMVFPRKLWVARKLQVPQIGIPRVQRNISRKKFWLKPKHFDLWAMNMKMPVSWQNSFGSVVIFAFRVSTETLWDKRLYFRKKYQFDSVCWFWWKNFWSFGKTFRQGCPNGNLRDERSILKKFFSGRRYNFKSFYGFSWENVTCKKTPGSSNRHFTCPAEQFEEEFSAETKTFRTLGNEQGKTDFLAKHF